MPRALKAGLPKAREPQFLILEYSGDHERELLHKPGIRAQQAVTRVWGGDVGLPSQVQILEGNSWENPDYALKAEIWLTFL